jgi:hypothetical protein
MILSLGITIKNYLVAGSESSSTVWNDSLTWNDSSTWNE